MKREKFQICAVFDTETCNLGTTAKDAHAIPILYIDNDIRDVDLYNYKQDEDDSINFYRYEDEYIERLEEYILWGKLIDRVPIVCAYNLIFDIQSLLDTISRKYRIEVNAQSSTNVYTLDICEDDKKVLRFWDTFHLDMRGLERMGEVAGLPKAVGSWDYSLIRTPETELTEKEYFYATRDVQVIPAYLRFLLHTNDWLKSDMFGNRVLTKTSLVRQMAKHEIGKIKIMKKDGKKISVEKMFLETCKQEQPKTYEQYAIRKACFRGGYTFTAARYASTLQHNTVSTDVTSMHHTFINGRMLPDKFKLGDTETLQKLANRVLRTEKSEVFESYDKPFDCAFHIKAKFKNIRLKKNTAFEYYGIALEPMSKFKPIQIIEVDESKEIAENELIKEGWNDTYKNAVFAFGKLYEAKEIIIHINEVELWAMSRVYEWDDFEVLFGEFTLSFVKPPDYVTLQSNVLYKLKDDCKFIVNNYKEGIPYPFNIPDGIPVRYAEELKDGTLSWNEFNAYYISDVKGKFNGIYGTMAQDVFKPKYACDEGIIHVDRESVVNKVNWEELQPKSNRVIYTYGMRIVGGSRLHMVLAVEEIYEKFGKKARILGGDTDSMKISFDEDITDSMISESLGIFNTISKNALDRTQERVRKFYPKMASTLSGIGSFDIENKGHHYTNHIELWNKCRVSIDDEFAAHVTCAGLQRPNDRYHIGRFIEDMIGAGYGVKDVLSKAIGYNVFVSNDICHTLEAHTPKPSDMIEKNITDYLGNTYYVSTHEVKCLYPAGRWLGETLKRDNAATVQFLADRYNRKVDTNIYRLYINGYNIELVQETEVGARTIMMCESDFLKGVV